MQCAICALPTLLSRQDHDIVQKRTLDWSCSVPYGRRYGTNRYRDGKPHSSPPMSCMEEKVVMSKSRACMVAASIAATISFASSVPSFAQQPLPGQPEF